MRDYNKRLSKSMYISLPEELGRSVYAKISYHIDNNGIGAYEFWGAPGFDRGVDFVSVDKITPIFDEPATMKEEILAYIENNFEQLAEGLENKIKIS